MRTLGNIIWFPFGVVLAIIHFLAGVVFLLPVVTAPIAFGLFQYAKFCFFPFTMAMVSKSDMGVKQNSIWRAYSAIFKVIYVISFGWIGFVGGLIAIPFLCIWIVTIPHAIAYAKSLRTVLNPVGKICVSVETRNELQRRKSIKETNKLLGEDVDA